MSPTTTAGRCCRRKPGVGRMTSTMVAALGGSRYAQDIRKREASVRLPRVDDTKAEIKGNSGQQKRADGYRNDNATYPQQGSQIDSPIVLDFRQGHACPLGRVARPTLGMPRRLTRSSTSSTFW